MARQREEIDVKIVQHIAVLDHGTKGWSTQLNLVSWNGKDPVLDIRSWSYDYSKFSKGTTMNRDTSIRLMRALQSMDLEQGWREVLPLGFPEEPEQNTTPTGFGNFQHANSFQQPNYADGFEVESQN